MPKMKTKSGAKKRFKITKSGKVLAGQAGKRHGMIKRSNDQIRRLRGTTVVEECDARVTTFFRSQEVMHALRPEEEIGSANHVTSQTRRHEICAP